MKPEKPRAPEVKSRPPGSGCRHLDEALFPALKALLKKGKAATAEEAALQLAKADKVYGTGTIESRARRLARRYRDAHECIRIPRQAVGESASVPAMATRTRSTPRNPDDATRLAVVEAAVGRLLDAQGAMAERVAKTEIMLTEVLESNTALRRENAHLKRQLERIARAAERRLDMLGVPKK